MSEENGKRSQMMGSLTKILNASVEMVQQGNKEPEHQILAHLSAGLLTVVARHQVTVTKFSGAVICEGCGELVGPDGALCEEMQSIWDAFYPNKRE